MKYSIYSLQRYILIVFLALSNNVLGTEITASFTVIDSAKNPIENAVIQLISNHPSKTASSTKSFELSQRNKQFTPLVLTVPKGASVSFPNYDDIQHHVYSFSGIKKFQFKLSKESKEPPITLDKAGIVPVGCNIHDWMLAYIVVADTPFFATTDSQGKASINVTNPGDYTIKVWHPQLSDSIKNPIKNNLTSISIEKPFSQTIELTQEISSGDETDIDEFDDY